jgi:hypothetical protein
MAMSVSQGFYFVFAIEGSIDRGISREQCEKNLLSIAKRRGVNARTVRAMIRRWYAMKNERSGVYSCA